MQPGLRCATLGRVEVCEERDPGHGGWLLLPAWGAHEATDLGGNADNNKVDPEGQTSTLPLFSYDNQSTTSSDLNIRIDINQAIPSYLNLKVSKIYNGWAWECTGNTDNNCVKVSISFQNIGKAVYSAGTQDLNIFVWGDFNGATVGQVDRNTTSESLAP